jgi:hypothetical protein
MNNNNKELAIGDKITSYDQLKEGMIISFDAMKMTVENAIVIKHEREWFAIHNDRRVDGQRPDGYCIVFGKEFGWNLGNKENDLDDQEAFGDDFGEDYSNVIFQGMVALNEKTTKLLNIAKNYEAFGEEEKKITKSIPDPIPSTSTPVKPCKIYKIGDIVKDNFDGVKSEVIGIYENTVWLLKAANFVPFRQRDINGISPWIEPLKYRKGDLVFLLPPATTLYVIDEVKENGYLLRPIDALSKINRVIDCTFDDKDISRKIGVAINWCPELPATKE